jgi:hypothetical protein
LFADRSSSAAELTAPHATTTTGASTRIVSPFRSTSTAATLRTQPLVSNRRTKVRVQSVTVGCMVAWRRQQTSASLFAPTLHGNELQVLHNMQPSASPGRSSPSGSGDGCNPRERSWPTIWSIAAECGTAS